MEKTRTIRTWGSFLLLLLLLFVFQLIREAGMRVPGSIGQAIGVIGGLILGQAAVAANLASSVMLIIVALSGLGEPDSASNQAPAPAFRAHFRRRAVRLRLSSANILP